MKKYIQILTALLLLTACNTNTPSAISVKGKIYKHPTAVQYLKFATDSVQYYGDFGNETLNNHTFAYTQKDEVVTVYTPTPEHLLAYEGFITRKGVQYEQVADTSDPNYQDHQPQDPATFSLVGKRYVYHSTTSDFTDTLEFVAIDTLIWSPFGLNEGHHYKLNYPQLIIDFHEDAYYLTFSDTTTAFCKRLERTYCLLP